MALTNYTVGKLLTRFERTYPMIRFADQDQLMSRHPYAVELARRSVWVGNDRCVYALNDTARTAILDMVRELDAIAEVTGV